MKTLFKIFIGVLLGCALCATAKAQNTFTFTNVPSAGTNASAATVTNATSTQVCPVRGGPAGVSSPTRCAIWPAGKAVTAGAETNTFTFANSMDGTTLVTANTWSVTLIMNGTTLASGYTLVDSSNYAGAMGFGLVSCTIGNTNGYTNGTLSVTWPY
jgi:hypothetical protein